MHFQHAVSFHRTDSVKIIEKKMYFIRPHESIVETYVQVKQPPRISKFQFEMKSVLFFI